MDKFPGKFPLLLGLTCLLGTASPALAKRQISQLTLQLVAGGPALNLTGEIRGYEIVDYRLTAKGGEILLVDFAPSNRSAYFNLLPPGSETALFIGSVCGNRFVGPLPMAGIYTVRIYLMPSAARRHESAGYRLLTSLQPAAPPCFARTLSLQGITFQVTSYCAGSFSSLKIRPQGLAIDNTPILRSLEGRVSGAEVADLNRDGSPEIYVYVTAAGSGAYGSLVAYAANNRKSLSEIYLPPLEQVPANTAGYLGHDEFTVLEGVLGRRFPVYRPGDSNARPSGGMRHLQYRLVPGEAGWLLRLDKVLSY